MTRRRRSGWCLTAAHERCAWGACECPECPTGHGVTPRPHDAPPDYACLVCGERTTCAPCEAANKPEARPDREGADPFGTIPLPLEV